MNYDLWFYILYALNIVPEERSNDRHGLLLIKDTICINDYFTYEHLN